MSRTRLLPALAAALLLAVCVAPAAPEGEGMNRINGIAMIDYSGGKPQFKVGTWVKYHVKARSELGVTDDYLVTVLIAGEEHWWGEDGFWVETWTDIAGQPPRTAATLMSYAIFEDSMALSRVQLYMRKTIGVLRDDGVPVQEVYKRAASSLRMREPLGNKVRWNLDTLGHEKLETAKGTFDCAKVRIEQGTGVTVQGGDSTIYTEVRENRDTWVTRSIPLTGIAREDIEYFFTKKAWLIGRSSESGPTRMMDRSLGTAELVDFGEGLTPRFVPEYARRTLAEQRAAAKKATAAKKSAARRKG